MNSTYDDNNNGGNNNDCVSSCLPLASCTEACQSIQHIIVDTNNDLACLHPVNYFNKLHQPHYFHDGDNNNGNGVHTTTGHHHGMQDDYNMMSGSPVMYAAHQQSLIIGLTKCEYCGNSNVHNCQGVTEVHTHLYEYQRRMMFDTANSNNAATTVNNSNAAGGEQYSNNNNSSSIVEDRNDSSSRTTPEYNNNTTIYNNNISTITTKQQQRQQGQFTSLAQFDTDDSTTTTTTSTNNDTKTTSSSNNNNNNNNNKTCHRPKLFFLKKRPPFASQSDPGWNTHTQHRTNLFEPPSSMEGVGRGYGEVRGQLGGCDLVNYTSPKNGVGGVVGNGGGGNSVGNSLKSPYQIYQRSYSLPIPGGGVNGVGGPGGQCASSVCGETELSFNGGSSGAALAVNNGYYNNNGGGRRSPVDYNGQHGGAGCGGSDAGGSTARSLSPLSWVNGSEMKGVMKWFA
jgi:hypothetical protein